MKLAELGGDEAYGESSRTFVFQDEGHTLGNALKSIITRYPEVVFCGYTIPHPSESKMNLRIQTNGPRATDILQRGLEDLSKVCDYTMAVFQEKMADYRSAHPECQS